MRVLACRLGKPQHARSGGQPDLTQQGKWPPRIAQGLRLRLTCCKHPATPPSTCLIGKGTIKNEPGQWHLNLNWAQADGGTNPVCAFLSAGTSGAGPAQAGARLAAARTQGSCVGLPPWPQALGRSSIAQMYFLAVLNFRRPVPVGLLMTHPQHHTTGLLRHLKQRAVTGRESGCGRAGPCS